MTRARTYRARFGRSLIAAVLLMSGAAAPTAVGGQPSNGEGLAIVVNPKTQVTDMSLSEVRRIFAGEQQFWGSGDRVTLLLPQKGTPARASVLRSIYRMTETEFTRFWIAKTFRDDLASGPKLMPTAAVTFRLVQLLPGAIGVVTWPMNASDVRVIRVEGKLPGEAGYPLNGRAVSPHP